MSQATFEIPMYGAEPHHSTIDSFSNNYDDPYTSSLKPLPQDYEETQIKEEYYENNHSRI
jgi:hypothetical protein